MSDEVEEKNINNDADSLLKKLFQTNDVDEEKYKIVKEFYTTNNYDTDLRTTTDIPKRAINSIIKLTIFGNACKLFEIDEKLDKITDIIDEHIIENYMALRISVDRKGRNEIFDKFLSKNTTDIPEKKGIFGGMR